MHLREIIELPNFKYDLEMFRQNYPDLDRAYAGIKEILLDSPSIGVLVSRSTDTRIYNTEPIADIDGETQGFYFVYTYDLDHI